MKYKIGDKVKIREDLEYGHTYDESLYIVTTKMLKYRGKVATIVGTNNYPLSYGIDLDEGHNWWSIGMFEDVEEVDDNEQVRTVDVGFHLDHCGNRVIENVWQGGWASECKERSVFFTTYDCKNQYTLPLTAIDWVIPHED